MNKQTKTIILTLLLCLSFCKEKEVKYQTFEVEEKDLQKNVEVNGSIESINVVDVYAPVSGRLEQMFVKEGDMVKVGQKIATMSSESRSQIIDMAASKGQAEIEYWKKQMLLTPIYAPVSGKVVIIRAFNKGERISGSIAQISTGEVIRANLDEADLPSVSMNQKVEIYFDIDSKAKLMGTLSKMAQVSKMVNSVNIYQIEVTLPDQEKRKKLPFEIKIGMSVTLAFAVNKKKNTKALSITAVNGKSSATVSLLKENGVKQKVKLGETYGDWVEVLSGLEVGDKIKVPSFNLQKQKTRKSPLMIKKE
jgi:macrolide-specific efflux system membrane fusion protein